MTLHTFGGRRPQIDPTAFVAPGAQVIGNVALGARASVWFNAVLRGDSDSIRVGAGSNVQDCAVVHVDEGYPAIIGENCVVGHRAIVHGCQIGDGCLIGMGSIIMNGVRLGPNCIVAAGTVVPEGKEFPARTMLMGVPARPVRQVTEAEVERIRWGSRHYQELARQYLQR